MLVEEISIFLFAGEVRLPGPFRYSGWVSLVYGAEVETFPSESFSSQDFDICSISL